jgi:hypothetical protein
MPRRTADELLSAASRHDGSCAHNGRPETASTFLKADLTAVGLGADLRHRRRIAPALLDFRDTCNATWLVERHGFRPPEAIRREQLQPAALAA